MANKGLKEYTKQISQTIGEVAKVSVNVNKEDANMHIIIPLFQTLGPNPLDLSLIFNYQDINTHKAFGKGCTIDTLKEIKYSDTRIELFEADGSSIKYSLDKDGYFYSKESPLKVTKEFIYISDDGEYDVFTFEDQQGNSMHFDEHYSWYPTSIKYANGFKTTLDGPDMDNGFGAKIKFTEISNNKYTKATYTQDGTTMYYVEFKYDTNQRITAVKHYKENVLVKHLSISYGTNKITVKDEILKDYAEYTFTNNCVSEIREVLNDNNESAIKTSISYEDRKTTITDNDGRKVYIYFDHNNLPLFEIDEDGNSIETEYNETTKKLTSESSSIPTKKKLNNLCSINIGNFSKDSGISTSVVSVNDSVLSGVLGTVYKVSGTGNLRYTFSTQGLGSDTITAVLWGRQLTAYSSSSNVSFELRADEFTSDEFKKKTIDNNFDMMTLGVTALKSYSSITLTITLKGNASIEIGGIQILKKDYGTSFVYDDHGNIIEAESGNGGITRTYDSTGLQTASIGKNSAVYCYDYDDKGRMTSARTAYGGKVEYTYDKNNNNLIRTIISNFNSSKKLETIYTYDSKGSCVASVTDGLLHITRYKFDLYGRLEKIHNALSETTEYRYDAFDNLKKILFNGSVSVDYDYDSQHKLQTATLPNGTVYSFDYDTNNNLKSVSMDGAVIVSFTYDSKTGLIQNQKYGTSGDSFDFLYNTKHNIKEIKINGALKYQYEYDDFDRLVKVKDKNGAVLKSYSYNNDGQVVSTSENGNTIDYSYDGSGKICQKKRISASKTIYESIDPVSKSKGFSPDNVIGYVQGSSEFLGTIFNRNSDLRNTSYACKALNYKTRKESDLIYVKKDGVSCVSCSLAEPMCYTPPKVASGYDNAGFIGFWFYPITLPTTYFNRQYLFSIKHRTLKSCIAVFLNSSAHLVLEAWDTNGTSEVREFNSNIALNKWNFFGLNFAFRDDGGYYTPVLDYELYHNDNCLKGSITNKQYLTGNAPYHIGYRYDDPEGCLELNCCITTLMIKNGDTITQDKMYEFYSITKDYITGAANLKDGSVDFGTASTLNLSENMLNQFDIFPLHGHAKSLKEKGPSIYNVRRASHEDRDRTYQFNNQIKRFAYVADEVGRLEYSLEGFSSGTILMRACINADANTSQFFFQLKDSNGQTISLFRGSNKYLFIGINGVNTQTDLYFDTNKWYTVGISFMEGVGSVSLGADRSMNVRAYLDGKTYSIEKGISNSYSQLKLSLGKLFASDSSVIIDRNCHPLLGQIEMLAIKAAYCEVSTLDTLSNELKDTTKVSEYDELGMLKKKTINHQGTDVLSTSYSYEMRSATEAFTSNRVQNETIKYGSSTIDRNYVYDALNRVTEIKDSTFGNHTYTYNLRGFLTKEDSTDYAYDDNGNITKAGLTTFSYDSIMKDRLKYVNDTEIKYEGSNPLNPSSWNGNTYEFEGRRLTKCNKNEYTYNDQGLRTSKTVDGNITTYYYDGDKLITEVAPTYRLDFLYDENNQLYGFIKDNTDKYYYIRDFMQNILGIIDSSGNLVVKYEYTAYGTITNTTGTLASTIGAQNPFRYKGYYYDKETGLYLVSSRYYNPEWCRFLNADSIGYLDPTNINGLNLFAYCYNDPINYVDPDGHFPILTAILCGLALAGMGLTIGGVASDNNVMTAVGLSMVAVPALVSGGMAIAAGIGGATLTGIVGGITTIAGVGTGLFASAEIQQASGNGNWMLDAGMSEGWYNGLMLTTASIATLGTIASSFCYSFNIKSISGFGKYGDYYGMRFNTGAGKARVLSFHTHGHKVSHGIKSIFEWHWQLQKWDSKFGRTAGTIARWIWWNLMRK